MEKIIRITNQFGSIHEATHVSEIDIEIEVDMESEAPRCNYCTLELECLQNKIPCEDNFLYRCEEFNF